MDLKSAIHIASAGMNAQSARLKVVAENIANVDSLATKPGGDPYRRKLVVFKNELDKELGINKVTVARIDHDKSAFKRDYEPGNPVADADGYLYRPNVNTMIESMDMKQAQRSYEANLSTIEVTKTMINQTLDLLR